MNRKLEIALAEYGLERAEQTIIPIGAGHINSTWLISSSHKADQFILQHINQMVFTDPLIIADNTRKVAAYLNEHNPSYLFVGPIPTLNGDQMAFVEGTYWRLTPYIPNSVTFQTLSDPQQAFEAALQFGRLGKLLDGFDVSSLQPSIPGFHDLNLRYSQFKEALRTCDLAIKAEADGQISKALNYAFIVDYYNSFIHSADFPDRVMHHDTKISNMLFDKDTLEGICVIDLDTLMPGKFISDLGDMMRTYLCAYSENESDPDKVFIRMEYFEAIITGYLQEMGTILTNTEKGLILFSGKYLIYMQALRFLTDFLNGNIYYPISYPLQNLDRTINQFKLLSEFFQKEKLLQDIVNKCLKDGIS